VKAASTNYNVIMSTTAPPNGGTASSTNNTLHGGTVGATQGH
jgi:hypothetical protein